jgi:3-isopropylmalate/(R)-2-methylmalate dehydratase small subunit
MGQGLPMKNFSGKALFLDRSDINTDEIIPARYLSELSREALRPYLFEDLKLSGFDPQEDIKDRSVIITRKNFGCGSSREHAPWALEVNSIHLVIAQSFARIFRRNMFNCGMLAVELSQITIDHLFQRCSAQMTTVHTDLERRVFQIQAEGLAEEIPFALSTFDFALVSAGGWLEYSDLKY